MIGNQDMLVRMAHLLFAATMGALADTMPNHGRQLFGSKDDTTCTPPSEERTTHDRLIKVTASPSLATREIPSLTS